MKVPALDLKVQYAALADEIGAALRATCQSAAFALGPEVARFEEDWAAYCEAEHCVAVNSGTDALHLALRAVGVGPGDEVITTTMTFIATCEAIAYIGAVPVLVDIDPATACIRADAVERAVTERTRAIVPVHLFGHPANMDPLLEVARRHGLAVVADACQAHGALYKGRKVGALADAGCFSYYPTKNLGAYGEGGSVVTQDAGTAEKVRILRAHGQGERYRHGVIGYNSRMHGFQGAVLNVKLKYLDEWNERRRAVADRYNAGLADTPLVLPAEADYARAVYHVYAVRCTRRDELREHLERAGVATVIHYPIPMHRQEALRDIARHGPLPEAERMAAEALSLPVFPEMTADQVDYVIETVRAFF